MRHPEWLRVKAPDPALLVKVKGLLGSLSLHTVCESARCPNQGECFSQGVVTIMILGDSCTRHCTFCAVGSDSLTSPDPGEPERVAKAVTRLGLRHVVITSVTRDDLPDGGASHFAATVEALRSLNPQVTIEVLAPDFQGSSVALETVLASSPAVLGHNVETVPRRYPKVRPQARYGRSLDLLRRAKALRPRVLTKSGVMVGLGESREEVIGVMKDLREARCDFLTIGQYLRPSLSHHQVVRFVLPSEFAELKAIGEEMGFKAVASAPLVRSSFHAAEMMPGGSAA